MPKTKGQEIIFTFLNSGVMIFIMGVYNVSLNMGGLSGRSIIAEAKHFSLEWIIGFLLAFFLASKFSKIMSVKILVGNERPLIKILCIQTFTVCSMVPMMSLLGTIMNTSFGTDFIFVWIQTSFLNFGVALLMQYFIVGPLCRKIFRGIFAQKSEVNEEEALKDGFAE